MCRPSRVLRRRRGLVPALLAVTAAVPVPVTAPLAFGDLDREQLAVFAGARARSERGPRLRGCAVVRLDVEEPPTGPEQAAGVDDSRRLPRAREAAGAVLRVGRRARRRVDA